MSLQLASQSQTPENVNLWIRALDQARQHLPSSFEQWFSSVQYDGIDQGVLRLTARDEFVRDWVRDHFQATIVDSLTALIGSEVRVSWRVSANLESPVFIPSTDSDPRPRRLPLGDTAEPARHSSMPPPMAEELRKSIIARRTRREQLNTKYTFGNFVVGPSNELAHAAAIGSSGAGGPRYNPLFLCGGTGLGKTHLMHAIAHQVLKTKPNACVLYVSAERFTNQFIEALQHHNMEEFRHRYRNECDLLLLDDIQFLAGREQTQEEFFHTFNALRDDDKPIVVSSDKYPQDLQKMPERLISRFNSGLVADIQTPALETRVAIVRKKAQLEQIPLGDDVAVLLAQNVKSNVRELEGTLIRLAAKSSLLGQPIDQQFAKTELAKLAPRQPDIHSVEDIQRAVCRHFQLTHGELISKDRHKSLAFARQVAMYLCRQMLECSYPELGRQFGKRDHTTVMSAIRRIEALREKDPQVNGHLEVIAEKLQNN